MNTGEPPYRSKEEPTQRLTAPIATLMLIANVAGKDTSQCSVEVLRATLDYIATQANAVLISSRRQTQAAL